MGFFDMDNQLEYFGNTPGPQPYYGFYSRSVPFLFFVCRESNSVAMTIYTKAFGSDYVPPSTWFNFAFDALYLDWDYYNEIDEEGRAFV